MAPYKVQNWVLFCPYVNMKQKGYSMFSGYSNLFDGNARRFNITGYLTRFSTFMCFPVLWCRILFPLIYWSTFGVYLQTGLTIFEFQCQLYVLKFVVQIIRLIFELILDLLPKTHNKNLNWSSARTFLDSEIFSVISGWSGDNIWFSTTGHWWCPNTARCYQ